MIVPNAVLVTVRIGVVPPLDDVRRVEHLDAELEVESAVHADVLEEGEVDIERFVRHHALEPIPGRVERVLGADLERRLLGVAGTRLPCAGGGERAGIEPPRGGWILQHRIADQVHAAGHVDRYAGAKERDGVDLPVAE